MASRNAKTVVDEGLGVGPLKNGVYLDFTEALERLGREVIEARYGNLFDMYESITGEDPYAQPMRIYPAIHYTMGGLWVDYNLQTNLQGLFVIGEANFSDHGANRLGASALMQGLADGYFIAPYTIGNYLAGTTKADISTDHPAVKQCVKDVQDRLQILLSLKGKRSATSFHRELGEIMWAKCGMARDREGLVEALDQLQDLKARFWQDLYVPGEGATLNQNLELAGRVGDLIELGELIALDALHREESCGVTTELRVRPRKGKRCGMMTGSPTLQVGHTPENTDFRACIKNFWNSRKFLLVNAVTSRNASQQTEKSHEFSITHLAPNFSRS